jgi:hypothetical protein
MSLAFRAESGVAPHIDDLVARLLDGSSANDTTQATSDFAHDWIAGLSGNDNGDENQKA